MKKLLLIILSVILISGILAGCGGKQNDLTPKDETDKNVKPVETEPEKNDTVSDADTLIPEVTEEDAKEAAREAAEKNA